MTDTISVIITAYNQDEMTKAHVQEVMKSSLLPMEVIVINDGGDPSLLKKLKQIDAKTRLIYARINEDIPWNYTGARNLGLWLSRGEFIASEDNDHIPHRDLYRDAINYFKEHPECMRVKSYKRHVVRKEDVLTKPMEEWEVIAKRAPHDDCTIQRREVFHRLKGFDERFAGEYAWSCTQWRRRLHRFGYLETTGKTGLYYVALGGETKGLKWSKSYRNYRLAKQQIKQSPHGILNFTYEYEVL